MLNQQIDNLILEARAIDNKPKHMPSDFMRAADIMFALDKFVRDLPEDKRTDAAKEITRKLYSPGAISKDWRNQAWAQEKK